jgi:hypothetical protein
MSEPVDPIRDPTERRLLQRRAGDRRRSSPGTALILAPSPTAPEPEDSEPLAEAAFTAQVLGQNGQKRGLKAGQPALEQARSAYLEAEYSGRTDRRPTPGRVTKTEI